MMQTPEQKFHCGPSRWRASVCCALCESPLVCEGRLPLFPGKLGSALLRQKEQRARRALLRRLNRCPQCGRFVCDLCYRVEEDCCAVCAGLSASGSE